VVSSDVEWDRLKEALGNPSWVSDHRFDTVVGRWEHRHELDRLLGDWTATQDDQGLMNHLQKHGVAAGAVLTAQDLVANPQLQERGYLQEFDNPSAPEVGPRVYAGRPFRISDTSLDIRHVATLGEHNVSVLRDIAGMSDSEIEALMAEGVISDRPKPTESAP
jgi:benzylsuccinate CoA-transferase BbsF subunit